MEKEYSDDGDRMLDELVQGAQTPPPTDERDEAAIAKSRERRIDPKNFTG